ncbi:diguanylate cyclase [Bradyrhizobium sp. 193]|uniref:diguanylate cyclase domain-containing protein n=1 Tax=unclassified Bradyrhizobium TaxID=2631580 RepID=UPI003211D816
MDGKHRRALSAIRRRGVRGGPTGCKRGETSQSCDAIRLLVTRLHIYHPGAQRQYVTISVGVAAKSDATADELRLTRDADIALYTAKEHGRDCTIASSTMVASRQEVTSLASSLPDMERAQ